MRKASQTSFVGCTIVGSIPASRFWALPFELPDSERVGSEEGVINCVEVETP